LHSSISKALTTHTDPLSGSKEIPSVLSLSLDWNETLPERKKEKRTTFDGYLVGGILKNAWMYRHKNIIPCVAVLLINWEKTLRESEIISALDNLK